MKGMLLIALLVSLAILCSANEKNLVDQQQSNASEGAMENAPEKEPAK